LETASQAIPLNASTAYLPAKDSAGNKIGITQRQDTLAQLIAQYPETAINPSIAAELYLSIPGVQATPESAKVTCYRFMQDERMIKRIELYRKVYGTSKPRLLAEREEITQTMVSRWKKNKKGAVRACDALQALRDREAAYGFGPGQANEVKIILANPRIEDAIQHIDIAPINNVSNEILCPGGNADKA